MGFSWFFYRLKWHANELAKHGLLQSIKALINLLIAFWFALSKPWRFDRVVTNHSSKYDGYFYVYQNTIFFRL